MFGALASGGKSLPIDFRLYLPKEWTDDPKRCEAAGMEKILMTAFANLGMAALGGAILTYILCQQRARRLDEQLKELFRMVDHTDGTNEVWVTPDEVLAKWEKELGLINSDVEKGADRFVRLNAKSKRALELLLSSLPKSKDALELIYDSVAGKKVVTTRQSVLDRIQTYRAGLSFRSFFESPWPNRPKDV